MSMKKRRKGGEAKKRKLLSFQNGEEESQQTRRAISCLYAGKIDEGTQELVDTYKKKTRERREKKATLPSTDTCNKRSWPMVPTKDLVLTRGTGGEFSNRIREHSGQATSADRNIGGKKLLPRPEGKKGETPSRTPCIVLFLPLGMS